MANKTKLKTLLVMAVILLGLAPAIAAGDVIYVDADASTGGDGTIWGTAYKYLQDALYKPPTGGDEIWVAAGTYYPDEDEGANVTPNDRTETFQLIDGIALYGGFAGGESSLDERDWQTNETILSGDLNGDDVDINDPCDLLNEPTRAENSYHVVTGSETDANAILDGFTITGGNANGAQQPIYFGGGIYNENQPSINFECTTDGPTIKNCTITLNSANGEGGGMYNRYSCNPQITDCVFVKNIAGWSGGAIKNDTSHPTINACTFDNNISWISTSEHSNGGAIDNEEGDPTCVGCVFRDNEAGYGGAVSNWMGWCDPTFINCIFIQNTALYGGVLWASNHFDTSNPEFINCTLADNSAMYGNAVACEKYSEEVINPSTVEITNCILWDGGDEIWSNDGSTITINYSNVQGSGGGGTNIDADPLFVDANGPDGTVGTEDDNLRLMLDSPCIDSGDNTALPTDSTDLDGDGNTTEPIPFDLDGNPRIVDGNDDGNSVVDMGAYEFVPAIEADIDIDPDTLNLKSKGKWITCYIWPPEGYDVADIDPNSVWLEEVIAADWMWLDEEELVAMAKFSRSDVQDILYIGQVELTISGELTDGTLFEGTDVIRVIDKGRRK